MDRKCIGCGAILQNLDREKEGYITKIDCRYNNKKREDYC